MLRIWMPFVQQLDNAGFHYVLLILYGFKSYYVLVFYIQDCILSW